MNSKQFLKILIAVVVIGGIGFWLNQSRRDAWKDAAGGGGDKVLGDFDINQVAGLLIKDKDGEISVARKGEQWSVAQRGDYPAKFSSVVDFIRKAADLKVVQRQQIGESSFGRMQVNPPDAESGAGTLVELRDAEGKAIRSLILGKEVMKKPENNSPFGSTEFAVGRWVINLADKASIYTVSETFSDADTDAKDWINKDFFKVTKLKSIAVNNPTNDYSWTVTREKEGGEWKLAGLKEGEETDASKLSAVGNPLSSPSFQDVAVEAKDDVTGLDKPVSVDLATFDGFSYGVKIGKVTGDNDYYFRVSVDAKLAEQRVPGKDEKEEDKERLDKEFAETRKKLEEKLAQEKGFSDWTYLVSKWTVDSFFKKHSDFLAEKKEEELKLPDAPTPLLNPPPTGADGKSGTKAEAKPTGSKEAEKQSAADKAPEKQVATPETKAKIGSPGQTAAEEKK